MLEAKLIGFKEGIKVAIVWFVFYSYLELKDKKNLIKPINNGLVTVCIITIIMLLLPQGFIAKEYLSNVIEMSFAFLLILSAAALFHASGTDLFEPLRVALKSQNSSFTNNTTLSKGGMFEKGRVGGIIIFLATLIFFVPDSTGSVIFLKELAFMRGAEFMTYAYSFAGFAVAVLIIFLAVKFYKPYWIGDYFDIPQLLLFLAIVKLLGGGIKGIAELSLIPSVQRGFMKFIHDFVHQTLVLLMIPDHPLLETTVWNFIGIFFGPNLASAASLVILLFFPLLFVYYRLFKPLPEPEAQTGVQRRKIKSQQLSNTRKKALPVLFFISLILVAWFSQRGETISRLYIPKQKPVVVDKGVVAIPLKDPTMNLMDGALHKFSLVHEAEEIGILIIKRSDNTLSVCLDACEICPSEGYGQRADHVVCLYCGTPLHIDTLGKPGGCNPIPLAVEIDGRFVRIELSEILEKWGFMKTGKIKKGIIP
jgi:hypothetical protein